MQQTSTSIAVYGAGSIGCFVGGCLQAAGQPITFIGRHRIGDALINEGLTLTDYLGRNHHLDAEQLNFQFSASAVADADIILLALKSGSTEQAASDLSQFVKPGAIVISLQNGLHNRALLQAALPEQTILAGMVPFNVAQQASAHFHRGTEGDLMIEALASDANQAVQTSEALSRSNHFDHFDQFKRACERAGLPIILRTDMPAVQWGKLLLNLNNAINALSGLPLLEQLRNADYRRILVRCIEEALVTLGKADIHPAKVSKVGAPILKRLLQLPNWAFLPLSGKIIKIDPKATSSMAEDLALNRPTEVDFLNGEVVSLGQQYQVKTPYNQAIVELIHRAEEAQQGSPRLTASSIERFITSQHH